MKTFPMKRKLTAEGQPCRHCGTPVVKQVHPEGWQPSPKQAYWYEYWFKCPNCRAVYMVDAVKRSTDPVKNAQKPQKEQLNTGADQAALDYANSLYLRECDEFGPVIFPVSSRDCSDEP